jgi:hypothetical protein
MGFAENYRYEDPFNITNPFDDKNTLNHLQPLVPNLMHLDLKQILVLQVSFLLLHLAHLVLVLD